MKRLLAYIILSFFLVVFFVSSGSALMKKITSYRYGWESPLGADNYVYGDLYGFSYLPQFRFHKSKISLPLQISSGGKNIDLYSVCDSYLWSFNLRDSVLYNVNKYYQTRWGYEGAIEENLDTSKINFLLIEITERQAHLYLCDTSEIYSKLILKNYQNDKAIKKHEESLFERFERIIANPMLKKNLEFNLYDYNIFTPLKELKAKVNYQLFDRVNSDVVVSFDEKYLFYAPTIDTASDKSSFRKLSEEDILKIVNSLNTMFEYYSKRGFQYIYFSIIPNPVSLLEPNRMHYNNLIQRVQNHPSLKVPFIDAYSILSKEPTKVYERNDTHWNGYGLNLWVFELNEILKKISR